MTRDVQTDVTVRIGHGKVLSVQAGCAPDAIELGNKALIDGLVNAHTHLEFSGLSQPLPITGSFTDWIQAVVSYRRSGACNVPAAIRQGLQESQESGTTFLGDIATAGWTWDDYANTSLRGTVFQELLGLLPERIEQQTQLARSHHGDDRVPFQPGISPHAPYSTHLKLVAEAVALAQQAGYPLAMHLAETEAELELLERHSGPFQQMLCSFGLWTDDPTRFAGRPIDYLRLLAQAPRSLIIHGNYLEDDQLSFMSGQPGMTLVYCPRTHAAFGHRSHPWRQARQLGVRVALGTDSRASNPDLSIFGELQHLAGNFPGESHVDLLQLGSRNGRLAFGIDEPDRADFTLIRLGDQAMCDPHRQLFVPSNRVCGTMINGTWCWRDIEPG